MSRLIQLPPLRERSFALNSKFTGPIAIAVPSFTQACAATGTCIPQLGTSDQLDSLGDRLMFRLAYRNLGAHESLVANHAAKTSVAASGVRWYEIRNPNLTPVVFQQGTLTSGGTSLWMGSIAMDKVGDLALGFSESSSTIHPPSRSRAGLRAIPWARWKA
jgi:hypothetical protein